MDKTAIEKFKLHNGLELTQAKNGGWIVFERGGHPGEMRIPTGAYSSATDMIAALSVELISTPTNTDAKQ